MRKRRMGCVVGVVVGVVLLPCLPLSAQTAISADGVVESTSGGFKFPDGTVQATAASTASAPVEDTGQQACWDASGNPISCAGTGQDGELQAGVDWPTPRFTNNLNGTVTDNLTGLIWLEDANCFGSKTWADGLSDANGLMTGSCNLTDGSVATDWRLPNVKELLSLVDWSQSSPALPSGHQFVSVVSAQYWSSTTVVPGPGNAWDVSMNDGNVSLRAKSNTNFVWPVRGGQ